MTDIHKPLPSCIDAEKGLIGSAMLAPTRVMELCQSKNLTSAWFHNPVHGEIFEHLEAMKKAGAPIDLISLTQWIEARKRMTECGGAALITELFTFVPTAANASYYATLMQEAYAARLVIAGCMTAAQKAYEATSLQDIHDAITSAFTGVSEVLVEEEREDVDAKMKMQFLDEMEDAATGKFTPDLFPTYLPTIDAECGGLSRGEILLIQGRRGCGKSLLGQSIVQQNSLSASARKSAIFTFEMPFRQYMRRIVACHGKVPLKSMREGRYEKRELDSFRKSMVDVMGAPIRIFDTERLQSSAPSRIFSTIRRLHKNEGLDMVMIDHLHLLSFSNGKKVSEKRTDELLHDFSQELKSISLELKIVSILLAQENTDGGTFGGTQVETDVDNAISLVPEWKMFNKINRIVGTKSAFLSKWREGNLMGREIPLVMQGGIATIFEGEEAVRASEPDF